MAVRKGLGKGLDALFMDNTPSSDENAPETVAISEIEQEKHLTILHCKNLQILYGNMGFCSRFWYVQSQKAAIKL